MAIETIVKINGVYFVSFTCHDRLPLIDTRMLMPASTVFQVIKENGNGMVKLMNIRPVVLFSPAAKALRVYSLQGSTGLGEQVTVMPPVSFKIFAKKERPFAVIYYRHPIQWKPLFRTTSG